MNPIPPLLFPPIHLQLLSTSFGPPPELLTRESPRATFLPRLDASYLVSTGDSVRILYKGLPVLNFVTSVALFPRTFLYIVLFLLLSPSFVP